MKYRIKETQDGRFQVIVLNFSFNWESVFTFSTLKDAENFIEENKLADEVMMADIPTIEEYFKI